MMENQNHNKQSIVEINLDEVSDTELQQYFDTGLLDDEIMAYAKDKNETSFIEQNKDHLTAVFLMLDGDYNHYKVGDMPRTLPILMTMNQDQLLVLTNTKTSKLYAKFKDNIDDSKTPLYHLFYILTLISQQYFQLLEKVANKRDKLIKDLQKRANKKNIADLAKLQTGSAYLLISAQQNADMLLEFKNFSMYDSASDQEKEVYSDAYIESRQLKNMTSLHSKMLNDLSSSYNNVLSNRLNDNMTNLTILSLGLAIMTSVTSFYGMNVKLPFAKVDIVWVIITILSAIVAIASMIWMRRYVRKDHDDD
ncbi:magnesium transporter CorA family protein [Streptococcus parauberis]|uniref:magnesium transporter CorA family protein n=1 Tax=Streptococcus parauberis TaxID=1348 RepID=UPI000E3020F8|nr:magnesium transporter CorA family protein [Streptococcus parauberis]RFE02613.1 CorA-like Mg2+ transporter protein [Streptococcus parauberis]